MAWDDVQCQNRVPPAVSAPHNPPPPSESGIEADDYPYQSPSFAAHVLYLTDLDRVSNLAIQNPQ